MPGAGRYRGRAVSEEAVEEGGGGGGEADDLVGGLAVELEVELGFGAGIAPVGEGFEFGAAEAAGGEGGTFDDDADARGLTFDVGLQGDGGGGGDDAEGDEAGAAGVFAGEKVDCITLFDTLAVVHGLGGGEGEGRGDGNGDFGFDGVGHGGKDGLEGREDRDEGGGQESLFDCAIKIVHFATRDDFFPAHGQVIAQALGAFVRVHDPVAGGNVRDEIVPIL